MAASVVVDTGPIVAFLDADDQFHDWANEQFARLRPPLLTCESVLTEACFLIGRGGGVCLFDAEVTSIARLLRRYKNVPMSLADACLVCLVEQTPQATLFHTRFGFRNIPPKGAPSYSSAGTVGGSG